MTPAQHNQPADHAHYAVKQIPLLQLFWTFFVFGVIGFGGPAAHLALMERELVTRRQWLSRQHFLDLLAAINLVPGPNSTEMALHIGLLSGGLVGLLAAGAGFILPAVFFSVLLAMLLVASQGSSLVAIKPLVDGLLLGVAPVILVLILSAAYRLAVKALDNVIVRMLTAGALIVVALTIRPIMTLVGRQPVPIPELALLLLTGTLYVLLRRPQSGALLVMPMMPLLGVGQQIAPTIPNALDMFWRFFVIGGTLFGSGYVLAAYMQRAFVDELGWLTLQQLRDVLAIGQATPGPVLSTASAAGFLMTADPSNLLSGVPGAIAATMGVFLPAFIIVLLLGRLVPYLRRYPVTLEFLKGVNASVIALLIGVFVNLTWTTVVRQGGVDWLTALITASAFIWLERFRGSPVALIIVSAAIGILRQATGMVVP
jgi:chromate transporter